MLWTIYLCANKGLLLISNGYFKSSRFFTLFELNANTWNYIIVCKLFVLDRNILLKQVLLKTIEHCLLIIFSSNFQVSLLFFLRRDLGGKRIVPKRFWLYFWSSSEVCVVLSWEFEFLLF